MKEHPIIFSTEMVRAYMEGRKTHTRRVINPQPTDPKCTHNCPYGEIGDILWVREAFKLSEEGNHPQYRANIPDEEWKMYGPWSPSIYMPRWACRLKFKTKNIWIEQIQDISEFDAKREGVILETNDKLYKDAFRRLWDKINAKRRYDWDRNPYVWVIEFPKYEVEPPLQYWGCVLCGMFYEDVRIGKEHAICDRCKLKAKQHYHRIDLIDPSEEMI